MKLIKFTFVLFLGLALFSCSEDEGTRPDVVEDATTNDLLGVWTITEITNSGEVRVTSNGVTVPGTYEGAGTNISATVSFTENPNNIAVTGTYTESYTVEILAQTETGDLPIVLSEFLSSGSWSLNNGIVTITQNGETQELRIIELTSSLLKLEFDLEAEVSLTDLDGALNTVVSLTLEK